MLALSTCAAAGELRLAIEDLSAPEFSLRGITARLTADDPARLHLEIASISLRGTVWRNARVECARLVIDAAAVECREGVLQFEGERVPVVFAYDARNRALEATLTPEKGEHWRLAARWGGPEATFEARVDGGRIARLARWLPGALPPLKAGTVTGTMAVSGGKAARGAVRLEGVAFSDSTGLHAGEGIVAVLQLEAGSALQGWRWKATGEWRAGEVFWQPVYLKANRQLLEAEGYGNETHIRVERARATVPDIGVLELDGTSWDRAAARLSTARFNAKALPLAPVYEQWLKPFFAGTALADLRADGKASLVVEVREGGLHALEVVLDKVSIEDRARRFAFFGATGTIPWRRDAQTMAEIDLQGGEALKVPFGPFRLPLVLAGERFALDRAAIPVLGGTLTVSDFSAAREKTAWRWQFGGELTPISVAQLTQTVGLPTMHGTLSGVIPQARYEKSTLSVGGALVFNMFDGTVTARNVVLSEPLGRAPRLTADLDMDRLDLDLLTRTFSFGSMTGRVDARVAGLELVGWQPVSFDARIESSPGDYRRTISQAAVANISALGGAGAATAIQRSFLRFFDRFGYDKLGLSCVLRDGVCTMDGIEPAGQGQAFVIVKGGGIPALSVIGYNRSVSWSELIDRLKRIMQDNVKAVIQ